MLLAEVSILAIDIETISTDSLGVASVILFVILSLWD